MTEGKIFRGVDSFKTDVDNTKNYTIQLCIVIAIAACISPVGPICCLSSGDELFAGPAVICTMVFSAILSVFSIVTCSFMGSIRSYDTKQRADLATLMDFNGCSDDVTAVSSEVVESSSISVHALIVIILMVIVLVVAVSRAILMGLIGYTTHKEL